MAFIGKPQSSVGNDFRPLHYSREAGKQNISTSRATCAVSKIWFPLGVLYIRVTY